MQSSEGHRAGNGGRFHRSFEKLRLSEFRRQPASLPSRKFDANFSFDAAMARSSAFKDRERAEHAEASTVGVGRELWRGKVRRRFDMARIVRPHHLSKRKTDRAGHRNRLNCVLVGRFHSPFPHRAKLHMGQGFSPLMNRVGKDGEGRCCLILPPYA